VTFEKKGQKELRSLQKELNQAKQLFEFGQYDEAYNIADRVYQESQALNYNILIFDALIIKATIPTLLGNLESIPNLIKQGENLLQTFISESLNEFELKKASLLSVKGLFHLMLGEYDKSFEFQKQVLTIQEKFENKKEIAQALSYIGFGLGYKGDLDESLKYLKKSQKLCEELNLKATKAHNLIALSAICYFLGKIERSLDLLNKSLIIGEELDHKLLIAMVLNNLGSIYKIRGDLDGAMKVWERCLTITEEIGFKMIKVNVLDFIIQGAIEKGDHKQANEYLQILNEINKKEKSKITNLTYRLNKALVLKMSLRARDRADAEDLLKEIINEEIIHIESTIVALLNLCDLLLTELQMTGDTEILDELQQYISQLLEISEKIHSYIFMAETYLLQARYSLLTLSLKESKRFFTQARQIAEKWGFSQLSMKISKERDKFLKQMNKWEKLKESDAPINERMELAQLDKQIERMLQNRSALTSQIIEEKVEVHKETKICMICKGDVTGYIYLCKCDVIYCENCVKALIDLENACWVCETPIDQSRPIKHFKKDEVEIKKKITSKEDREPIRK